MNDQVLIWFMAITLNLIVINNIINNNKPKGPGAA